MEFAEGGSLDDKIIDSKKSGVDFLPEEIISWTAQMILGVMQMHSKSILHRDIKSQNMFMTKDGTLKIGDFGISRQVETLSALNMTACGTPYFMSPEVCKGEPYGPKADIWAIGCILYEMVTHKKPYDGENIQKVIDIIKNKEAEPVPEGTNTDVKMLISKMLCKDQQNRPYAWQIAAIPCIRKAMKEFVEKLGCQDQVIHVFDPSKDCPEESIPLNKQAKSVL
jgi:NIMA (never in mitosis gene a)-related kinase